MDYLNNHIKRYNLISLTSKIKKGHYGLLSGRHYMPVEDYLIRFEITAQDLTYEKHKDFVCKIESELDSFIVRNNLAIGDTIKLLLTGLSRLQHIVINYLTKQGIHVQVYDYSQLDRLYFKITTYEGVIQNE